MAFCNRVINIGFNIIIYISKEDWIQQFSIFYSFFSLTANQHTSLDRIESHRKREGVYRRFVYIQMFLFEVEQHNVRGMISIIICNQFAEQI